MGILGLAFKENVSDIRNSRVPDIVNELVDFGVNVPVHDPHAKPGDVDRELGIGLSDLADISALDALVVAVSHKSTSRSPRGRAPGAGAEG